MTSSDRDIAGLMEKLSYKPADANRTLFVLRKMFKRTLPIELGEGFTFVGR